MRIAALSRWWEGRENTVIKSGGIPILSGTFGNVYYVDPDADNASDTLNDGSFNYPFSTLAAAYAAATSNNNDLIILNAYSTHSLTSMLTVAKNRVHIIGWDGGGRLTAQRTKINLTGSTGATNVAAIKVTGVGCSFGNLKVMNSHTVAQSLYALADVGEANSYYNCSFHNLAAQHLTDAGAAPLLLAGDGSTFRECEIGADTVQVTVASGHTILVDKILGGQAKRCIFDRCTIQHFGNKATHNFIKVDAEGDLDRYVLFRECQFINFANSSGATITDAIEVPAAHDGGFILVDRCSFYGCTNVSQSGINSQVLIVASVPTAATSGLAVTAA